MNAHTTEIAPLRSLAEIVDEYETKLASIPSLIEAHKVASLNCEMAASIGGAYGGSIWSRYGSADAPSEKAMVAALLTAAWKHVYEGLNIAHVASAADRKRFEQSFEAPPQFTLDNIRATFGDYLLHPRHHILKGLAEAFCDLDPAFKSHSKVKIGVTGLPKRVIISGAGGSYYYGSYGSSKLFDTINALLAYRSKPHMTRSEFSALTEKAGKEGIANWAGGTLRIYQNGNAHLAFDQQALRDINLALAEFYGDVLPDSPEAVDGDQAAKRPTTEVAKDLQFYPTPRKVIETVLSNWRDRIAPARWRRDQDEFAPLRILEPSCGDGRILDVIREWSSEVELLGVEYDSGRAAIARAKGHAVYQHNFLDMPARTDFDLIVMNPPFFGQHWRKHLAHALKFRSHRWRDNGYGQKFEVTGAVICILPSTAFYDGHLEEFGVHDNRGRTYKCWHDLPVGSFAESGTNVPTGWVEL